MTKAARLAAQRAAYNQGYKDGINGKGKDPATSTDPLLSFYYLAGHEEAQPKRLVPTTIITPSGPRVEYCTLERAAYLQSIHLNGPVLPGGRR